MNKKVQSSIKVAKKQERFTAENVIQEAEKRCQQRIAKIRSGILERTI